MKVEIKEKFKVVKPEDGYKLTNYKDGDDIMSYSSFVECVCPLNCDLEHLNEITIEQDAEYIRLAIEAIEKLEANRK